MSETQNPAALTDPQPWPARGLSFADFSRIAENGLGDPYNAYPHSMELFNGRLYVGTTRANLCMLKISRIRTKIKYWPVECPDNLYELDMRAQIHALDFETGRWRELFRSPMIDGTDGMRVPREMGYRCMAVFQGEGDDRPVLYCGTYASVKGQGAQILRSADGEAFDPVPKPEGVRGRHHHAAAAGAVQGAAVHLAHRERRRQSERGDEHGRLRDA